MENDVLLTKERHIGPLVETGWCTERRDGSQRRSQRRLIMREPMKLELILTCNLFAADANQMVMPKAGTLRFLSHNNKKGSYSD